MTSPAEALRRVVELVTPLPNEEVSLLAATGRVLRRPVRADRAFPPFPRVMTDGLALASQALAAGRRRFPIAGSVRAGEPQSALPDPYAAYEVTTGSVLPLGCDTVLSYGQYSIEGRMAVLPREAGILPMQNVHRAGSDFPAHVEMLAPGEVLNSISIAIAAGCGETSLGVSRQPSVVLVSIGTELVEPGRPVAEHQLRRTNPYAVSASLRALGYPAPRLEHLRDGPGVVEELLPELLFNADVIVFLGGVARGSDDNVPQSLERMGLRPTVHGVNQNPGRRLWFGARSAGPLIFVLPGNPVAAMICFHYYVVSALQALQGGKLEAPSLARLDAEIDTGEGETCFLPVKIRPGNTGTLLASPCTVNNSGDFGGLTGTSGFLELPAKGGHHAAGTVAPFHRWW